jgi:copper(I)-binding protein
METLMARYLKALPRPGVASGIAVTIIPLAAAVLMAGPASAAGDYDAGAIHVSQPWARATPKGATTGAGYMTITNKGNSPDKVTCISDDASAKCQIHTMTMEGGMMKMRPAEDGLEIKAGESVTLKPGGYHVMFEQLKHPLQEGQSLKATLKFEHAGTIEVDYPILAIGAPAPGVSPGGTMGSGGMNMQGSGGMMQMQKR